jgi:hypothetical protein
VGQTCLVHVAVGSRLRCIAKALHEDGLAMQDVGAERENAIDYPWGWLLWERLADSSDRAVSASQRRQLEAAQATVAAAGWVVQHGATIKLACPLIGRDGTIRATIGSSLFPGSTDQRIEHTGRRLAEESARLSAEIS